MLLNSLIKRDDLFWPVQQSFNSIIDEFFNKSNVSSIKGKFGYPKIDVITNEKEWIVQAVVAGCDPENVKIEILPYNSDLRSIDEGYNQVLKISCKINNDYIYEKGDYHIKELKSGWSERTILLPNFLEGDPEATIKNGILKLTWQLPETRTKKEEVKRIEAKKLD